MSESFDGYRGTAFLERYFVSNYTEISRWAMQIAQDRSTSEDLVHDAFLKLSRATPSRAMADLNSYVYVSMRNTFRTNVQKGRRFLPEASANDNHTLSERADEVALAQSRVAEELFSICEYACSRKSRSISASILILRFFLGYFPAEISRVVNRSRNSVDLRIAAFRRELEDQRAVSSNSTENAASSLPTYGSDDLFERLRAQIGRSVEGRCFTVPDLKRVYRKDSNSPSRKELSHLVSCETCLDLANSLLRLAPLSQRNPIDSLRSQTTIDSLLLSRSNFLGEIGSLRSRRQVN
jgi:DNA-directed RNA polymerase specialized sigma24 family protein